MKILSVAILAAITGVLSLIVQQSPGVLTGKSMMLMFFGFVFVVIFSILAIFVYRDNLKMLTMTFDFVTIYAFVFLSTITGFAIAFAIHFYREGNRDAELLKRHHSRDTIKN
ncbi:MAG TPA: hypothetical protein VIM75_13575 [Ohtaekwangia sp.]